MKYAIISLAGKQYYIKEGDTISVPQNTSLVLTVSLFSDGKDLITDSDSLNRVSVTLDEAGTKKNKVMVKRFKSKSRYRKTTGHKQPLTLLKVTGIGMSSKSGKNTNNPKEEKEVIS